MKSKIIIIFLFLIIAYETYDRYSHNYIIDNIFKNQIGVNQEEYIGYIEIENVGIKREIVRGINDKNLLTHVTFESKCGSLDCDHIILAGHCINNIFKNLHNIKKNDDIKIITNNDIYYYSVYEMSVVRKDNTSVLNEGELILITCTYNPNYRLIIKAKKKNT